LRRSDEVLAWSAGGSGLTVVAGHSWLARWAWWAIRGLSTAAAEAAGLARLTAGLVEHLRAGHFAPDVARAELAEVEVALHLRVDLLDALVSEGHGNDGDERGDGGQADAHERHSPKRLGLALALFVVQLLVFHRCSTICRVNKRVNSFILVLEREIHPVSYPT
jgi:hypothetical protein